MPTSRSSSEKLDVSMRLPAALVQAGATHRCQQSWHALARCPQRERVTSLLVASQLLSSSQAVGRTEKALAHLGQADHPAFLQHGKEIKLSCIIAASHFLAFARTYQQDEEAVLHIELQLGR